MALASSAGLGVWYGGLRVTLRRYVPDSFVFTRFVNAVTVVQHRYLCMCAIRVTAYFPRCGWEYC